jgi:hypothetical protein
MDLLQTEWEYFDDFLYFDAGIQGFFGYFMITDSPAGFSHAKISLQKTSEG